jgi:hypothetical protein
LSFWGGCHRRTGQVTPPHPDEARTLTASSNPLRARESLARLRRKLDFAAGGDDRSSVEALVLAYLRTPDVWPLDHRDHAHNLALLGLWINGEATLAGGAVTAFIIGTGWAPITCGPSERCRLVGCPVPGARHDVVSIELGRDASSSAWVHLHLDERTRAPAIPGRSGHSG